MRRRNWRSKSTFLVAHTVSVRRLRDGKVYAAFPMDKSFLPPKVLRQFYRTTTMSVLFYIFQRSQRANQGVRVRVKLVHSSMMVLLLLHRTFRCIAFGVFSIALFCFVSGLVWWLPCAVFCAAYKGPWPRSDDVTQVTSCALCEVCPPGGRTPGASEGRACVEATWRSTTTWCTAVVVVVVVLLHHQR